MGIPLELRLQLKQATLLKNVLEALSDMFSHQANFEFSSTGCEVQAMDTSSVVLVSFLLRADALYHYTCYRDLSMGLNLAAMAEVLRCANDDDIITIKVEECWSDTLAFKFMSPKTGEISIFYFDVVDVDGVPLEIPETESQAKVRLPTAQFMRICKKLSIFGDREDRDTVVTISVDKKGVDFFTRGKNGTSRIVCPAKEPTLVETKEDVSLMFALKYIKSFSEVSTLSDQVTISLAPKKPAVFEYEIAGMGYIRYYISPLSTLSDQGTMLE